MGVLGGRLRGDGWSLSRSFMKPATDANSLLQESGADSAITSRSRLRSSDAVVLLTKAVRQTR